MNFKNFYGLFANQYTSYLTAFNQSKFQVLTSPFDITLKSKQMHVQILNGNLYLKCRETD